MTMKAEAQHRRWALLARIASVIALFAIGGDHLYEYTTDHYSVIPTIGTLFLLNAIGGFGLGLALLVPVGRVMPRRQAELVTAALATAGIGLAAGSLAGLFISESTPLFGFMEFGYRTSIVIAIVSEAGAIVALVGLMLTTVRRAGALRPAAVAS
jgi:hypothetical protein